MFLEALAGVAAGAAHALMGPDHLAAAAPLAADRPRGAWRLGARWGAGHALGVLGVGALALGLRDRLDLAALSGRGEWLAGAALAALGVWGLHRTLSRHLHAHEHEHDGVRHHHLHAHAAHLHRPIGPHHDSHPHHHSHMAFGMGILHGVAGTSHLLGVIPALALPGAPAAIAYVVAFSAGTLAAMIAWSALIGRLAGLAGSGRAYRWWLSAAASSALGVGLVWILS